MKYENIFALKNGQTLVLRSGCREDAKEVLEVFNTTHGETDYLLSYPEENSFDEAGEAEFLQNTYENDRGIEILGFIEGKLAGMAGIHAVGEKYKVRHRAEFGISILKEYWRRGIGEALTKACIECAKEAGFTQLELDAVVANEGALALYKKVGFVEYGRHPKGFNSKNSGYQEVVYMRKDLE